MNQLEDNKRVALITGASRGIGAEVARRLAQDGFAVVVNYAGKAAEAAAVVEAIQAQGGQAMAVQADVSDPASVRRLFDVVYEAWHRVDVLVNNAGIMPPHLPHLSDTTDEEFDRLVNVNLKGTFNTMREAARRMQPGGRILNFSSSLVGTRLPGYSVYSATKVAVEVMTNILAKELRGRQITVNAIAPGPTATALFLDGKTPEQIDRLAKMAPLERLGEPVDIANAVSMFASSDASWINGQTLRVNGGMI